MKKHKELLIFIVFLIMFILDLVGIYFNFACSNIIHIIFAFVCFFVAGHMVYENYKKK